MNRIELGVVLTVALVPSTAMAQATPPDPATVTAPAITNGRDPAIVEDGWKHFYFHRADTSYVEAYSDLADCYRFLPVPNASGVTMPGFAPWRARADNKTFNPVTSNYGLVGDLIGAMVAGPIERRARQSRMRRCMEPRGYRRYPMSEDAWKVAVSPYSPATLTIHAKLASGPPPDADPVPETK